MKKYMMKSILALAGLGLITQAHAGATAPVSLEQIGGFLCEVQLCKNEAIISNIKIGKYNLPNLAERLAASGKQVLTLSFHQETPNKEYVRDYTECNLIVSSPTVMSLSGCKISGTVAPGKSSRTHQLSIGDGEIMRQQENGWLAGSLSNK